MGICVEILPGFKPTTYLSAQSWGGLNITKKQKRFPPQLWADNSFTKVLLQIVNLPETDPDNKTSPFQSL